MKEAEFNNGITRAIINRFNSFSSVEKIIFMLCVDSIIYEATRSNAQVNVNHYYILHLDRLNKTIANHSFDNDIKNSIKKLIFKDFIEIIGHIFMEPLSYHVYADNGEISYLHVKLFPSISWPNDSNSILNVNVSQQFQNWLNEILNEANYSYPKTIQLIGDKIREIKNIS